MENRVTDKSDIRQSGIELLKIVVMFLIVVSHVIQSIGQISPDNHLYNGNVINLCDSTYNPQYLIMAVIWNFVMYGVDVFFVSSAWFLSRKGGFKISKLFRLAANTWIISFIYLSVYLLSGVSVSGKLIIKSLLPNLFANNWFVSCYIILYAIHPLLNILCEHIDRRLHGILVITGMAYCLITYISEYLMFYSKLIIVVIIYITVCYVRKYMGNIADRKRMNATLFLTALTLNISIILLINAAGSRYKLADGLLMHSNVIQNPFIILMSITSFNLFRLLRIRSRIINYLSSLTLFIYLIHENILFRTYSKPAIWNSLLTKYGYGNILICSLSFAFVLFISSVILSALYDISFNRLVGNLADKISS